MDWFQEWQDKSNIYNITHYLLCRFDLVLPIAIQTLPIFFPEKSKAAIQM